MVLFDYNNIMLSKSKPAIFQILLSTRAIRCPQRPLVWLMDKARAQGLDKVEIDVTETVPAINDSYSEFGKGFYHYFSKRFFRSVGIAPEKGTSATTSRINETIDGSVFDRWRADTSYRPQNLVGAAWPPTPDFEMDERPTRGRASAMPAHNRPRGIPHRALPPALGTDMVEQRSSGGRPELHLTSDRPQKADHLACW